MGAIVVSFRQSLLGKLRFAGRNVLLCCVAATLVGCAWLDVKQRTLVYRPTPGRPVDFKGLLPDDLEFDIPVPGAASARPDSLHLWWLPNADPQAPAVLYLHGTFRNLYQNLRKVEALRTAGFSVVAVEYRGWGDSTPIVPSEASIYADANVAWGELVRRQGDPHKRAIYGHSMGSGVAVELASHKHAGADYGALILESSFTRLPDVAKANGTLGTIAALFATQEFASVDKIGRVDAPILMLHGTKDTTVPVDLGRGLRDAAPKDTRWVEFPDGSHSDLDIEAREPYQQALRDLVAELR